LGWFENLTGDGEHLTIEKLAKMNGQIVTRGSIDATGGVMEYSGETEGGKS
jgi:mitochondrial protein import protein ZIM17